MGLPVARDDDPHSCPEHTPGNIDAAPAAETKVDGRFIAVATDKVWCIGPLDYIVTGSGTTRIGGKPVARQTDHTMHGGVITGGSATLRIGGPTVGVVIGNVEAGIAACNAAKAGRVGNLPNQSYYNCALEAMRILGNKAAGQNYSELAVLKYADWRFPRDGVIKRAPDGAEYISKSGASDWKQRQILLDEMYGLTTEAIKAPTIEQITQAVADDRGVLTPNSWEVLNTPQEKIKKDDGGHGLIVVGVGFDQYGKPSVVHSIDPMKPDCLRSDDPTKLMSSVRPDAGTLITMGSIW